MDQKRIQAWLLLFIIIGSALTFTFIPYTPAHSIYNEDWDGASRFRESIESNWNYTTSRILVSPIILESPNNISIMIIIGSERKYSDAEKQAYVDFVENGGSLIIFEDFGPSKYIAKRFGISYMEGKIKEYNWGLYKNRPSQFLIRDILGSIIFPKSNLTLMGTDVAAVIDWNGLLEGLTLPLLASYPSAFLDTNDNDIIDGEDWSFKNGIYIGLFKRIGNGTVTVIGDSSIPLNVYWERKVEMINPTTHRVEQFILANAFWCTMLVGFIAGFTNSTNVVFDESHQAIAVTSAAGLLNLVAGTWVGLIHTPAVLLTILTLTMFFTGISLRSRFKARISSRRRGPKSVVNINEGLISHPNLAERMISEQYILYQVMGHNFIHVANSNLVNKLEKTGKAEEFLKQIREVYGQDLKSTNLFPRLLDLHLKLQKFVEVNKNRLL